MAKLNAFRFERILRMQSTFIAYGINQKLTRGRPFFKAAPRISHAALQ